jgi:HSP20 family protein
VDKQQKRGLEGLFRGIATILQTANDIAVRAGDDGVNPIEVERAGTAGIPGAIKVAYGASMRVGPRVAPPYRRPRTVRRGAGREPIIDDACEPIVDVFDEGDHVVVIAELPGVAAPAITWRVQDGRQVVIHAESAERKYVKTIELPGPVNGETGICGYANGVMELRLWKA